MPVITIPAPLGGMHCRQSANNPNFAVYLENWISRGSYLEVRPAFNLFNAQAANILIPHISAAGVTTLIASRTSGSVTLYKLSSPNVTLASGLTNSNWVWTQFQNKVILCNGADAGSTYDGTTYTALVVTGPTNTSLAGCHTFKGRVYYWKDSDQSFYYAAAGSYQGALTQFDMGTALPGGGYLLAMATITNDGGEGADDLAAFIFSTGTVLIYQGDDPGAAKSWQLIGRFKIPTPLGKRCLVKIGATLAIITTDGMVDLGRVLADGRYTGAASLSSAMDHPWRQYTFDSTTNNNWSVAYCPNDRFVLVIPANGAILNNPLTNSVDTERVIFCMETDTMTWSVFKGFGGVSATTIPYAVYGDASGTYLATQYCVLQTTQNKYDSSVSLATTAHTNISAMSVQNGIRPANGRIAIATTAEPYSNLDPSIVFNCRASGSLSASDAGASANTWSFGEDDVATSAVAASDTLARGNHRLRAAVTAVGEVFSYWFRVSQQVQRPIRWYETRLGFKLGGSR